MDINKKLALAFGANIILIVFSFVLFFNAIPKAKASIFDDAVAIGEWVAGAATVVYIVAAEEGVTKQSEKKINKHDYWITGG